MHENYGVVSKPCTAVNEMGCKCSISRSRQKKIQGTDQIEIYYSKLTTIWKEIERLPNPMLCLVDKNMYDRLIKQSDYTNF